MKHDEELAARLRSGDESAFAELVDRLHGRLLAFARTFCPTQTLAEEAVQETWLAVIRGIGHFEGRAPLRSWIFGILANRARTLSVKERRRQGMPLGPNPGGAEPDDPEPGMGAAGRWVEPPAPWGLEDPAAAMVSRETLEVIEEAIASLPESQRQVLLLRDVEGLGAEEVCNVLGLTDTNQRVLLHRARVRVRRAIDRYVRGEPGSPARGKGPVSK